MSYKRLIPLALVIVILGVAVMFLKKGEPPKTLREETQLQVLVPQSIRNATCRKLEIIDKEQQVLTFLKTNDRWQVASYLNAPVEAEKFNNLFNSLSGLLGEERANDEKLLADFELAEQAEVLNLYTTDLNQPEVSLLIGKSLDYRNSFVRLINENKVYLVSQDLKQTLTLSTDDFDQRQKLWVDMKIMKAARGSITRIVLRSPLGESELVKSEQEVEVPHAEGETEAAKPKTTKKIQWLLDGEDIDQARLNLVLNPLLTLKAVQLHDTNLANELGLDLATHSIEVTEKSGEIKSLSAVKDKEKALYYLKAPAVDVIYEVAEVTFDKLFQIQAKEK